MLVVHKNKFLTKARGAANASVMEFGRQPVHALCETEALCEIEARATRDETVTL